MKEITMITTCEITCVEVLADEDAGLLEAVMTDVVENEIADTIKGDTGADNVNILKNQFFIRDLPDQ